MTRACVTTIALLILVASPVAWAQQAQAAEKKVKPAKHSADWVESRITKLHDKLHIQTDQETAWNAVALAMRDNAKTMKVLVDKWSDQANKMSALDSMRHHGEMAEEHAKGQRNIIPAFEKLYNMMSPEQKTIADMVFARHEGRKHHKNK